MLLVVYHSQATLACTVRIRTGSAGDPWCRARTKQEDINVTEDRILINDLLVRGILGINEWERTEKQDILVNIELGADLRAAGRSDNVEDSVNYRTVAKRVVSHVESSARHTAEALAEDLVQICLTMPGVKRARVRVEKPGAVRFARSVGVEIERRSEDRA